MKRIISFFIVILILIFNCSPVFALDSYVASDFKNFDFWEDHLTVINTNIKNYKYVYFAPVQIYWGKPVTLVFSNSPLDFIVAEDDVCTVVITNNTSETVEVFIYSHYGSETRRIESSNSSRFTFPNGGNHTDAQLLIYNTDCVSEKYCSTETFVPFEPDNGDDYTEDGVVIKGLSGFFNSIKQMLNEMKESILNIPQNILNGLVDLIVPDIETMKLSFNNFIDYMTSKFGFNDLIETLQGLVDSVSDDGSTVGAADITESFTYTIGDSNIEFNFSIPFSDFYSSVVKNRLGGYMKGIFFLLLIFYNLSELYFLIRGVRPWKDPQISMIHNEIERNDINSYIANVKGGDRGV